MEQYSPVISPKSSPRSLGGPSASRPQDTTTSGTLKTTISLGRTPSIVHTGPFYLVKELPPPSERTGASNLMSMHNLEHAYNKCSGKKVRDQLSSFLPSLPGLIDTRGSQDDSSLRSVIEKHRLVQKELLLLTAAQLSGFRLHPEPLLDQYRFMTQSPTKNRRHKQKRKRHRLGGGGSGGGDSTPEAPSMTESLMSDQIDLPVALKTKHKKTKKHGDEERRKKKKEKKRKRQKNDTPPPSIISGSPVPIGVL